ncbi:MAG: BlaI/MecI/CopY family transcriptional regulator [Cyclonatronaceae bacterium]
MRKSLTPVGETEMEVLNHVWDLGEASVNDVLDRILKDREVAYTTIMTVMKNLTDKNYLKYKKNGNKYIYSAAVNPDDVRFNLVDGIVEKVFRGSPKELMMALSDHEKLSDKEREELRSMIDKMDN